VKLHAVMLLLGLSFLVPKRREQERVLTGAGSRELWLKCERVFVFESVGYRCYRGHWITSSFVKLGRFVPKLLGPRVSYSMKRKVFFLHLIC
jgi:hypothetical protein